MAAISAAPRASSFDPSGKTLAAVFQAVCHGYISPDEANIDLQLRMLSATEDADITKIGKTMETINTLKKSGPRTSGSGTEGALLYVYARTEKCMSETEATVALKMAEEDGENAKGQYSAKLGRPTSMSEFMSRLNVWVMVCHATGVAPVLATTAFLEEVVYGNLRVNKDWKVVHELFLVYLRQVDSTPSLHLTNVYASGGQDSKFKEAETNALKNFRHPRGDPAGDTTTTTKLAWNCASAPQDPNGQRCFSFNLKQSHPHGSIKNGKCIYRHVCDHFLKGPDGKKSTEVCGGAHPRVQCDNKDKFVGGKQAAGGD